MSKFIILQKNTEIIIEMDVHNFEIETNKRSILCMNDVAHSVVNTAGMPKQKKHNYLKYRFLQSSCR